MTFYEKFVKQLDGCSLCGGAISGGDNCTCASDAMWLYRATQGTVKTSACHVRDLTNDCDGGTNLAQVESVNQSDYGASGGRTYFPIKFDILMGLIKTGRYGAIFQGGYSALRYTQYDASRHAFGGGHAIFLSRPFDASHIHGGDPLADGRYSGCPSGYQNYPITLLQQFADALPLRPGVTLRSEYGPGYAYAYLTPIDPAPQQAVVVKRTELYRYQTGGKFYPVSSISTGTFTTHRVAGDFYLVHPTADQRYLYIAGLEPRSGTTVPAPPQLNVTWHLA